MKWAGHRFTFDFHRTKPPLIMGIINVTPDSFSDGALFYNADDAYKQACSLVSQGADIIDIGAESTRPGSLRVSTEEEQQRLLPVVEKVVRALNVPVSIDTCKAEVARTCLDCGASIINDVSGLKADPSMATVIKEYNAGVVIMHMRGTPATMQQQTQYTNLIEDIKDELESSLNIAHAAGIDNEAIAIDPGIGFAKTTEQNVEIINELKQFLSLNYPIVIGTSRKSFIGNILNREVNDRIAGTLASNACAVDNGAHILRVHDVKETHDFFAMMNMIASTI